MARDLAYRFSDGGQFEIFVRPQTIPVSNPGCKNGIVIRMPWTNPNAEHASLAVEGKRAIFSRLEDLRAGQRSSQEVIIELNPYVAGTPSDPTKVSLTQCNVFFRHAQEAYVDRLSHSTR